MSEFDRLEAYLKDYRTVLADIRATLKAGITIRVEHVHDAATAAKLDTIIQQGATMSASLDALTAKVAETKSIAASAVTLLQGLKAALDAAIAANNAGDNGAALDALAADLGSTDTALAAAITANTPTPPVAAVVALPQGVVGQPYSGALPSISGTAPFSHTVTAGALPDGLTLDLTSGGVIPDYPTTITGLFTPKGNLRVLDRGQLTIGVAPGNIYRDNASNTKNEFTIFQEGFEGLMDFGATNCAFSLTDVCLNGAQVADVDAITCGS